jgi:hypothetical protein
MKNFEKFLTKKNIFLLVLIVVLLYFSDVFSGSMREGADNMNTKIKVDDKCTKNPLDDACVKKK